MRNYAHTSNTNVPLWCNDLQAEMFAAGHLSHIMESPTHWAETPVADTLSLRSVTSDVCPSGNGLRVYFSSGLTGSPKRMVYSPEDWRETVLHRAECLSELGIGPGDTVAVLVSFGPWFSGDNIVEAVVSLGARAVPTGIHSAHLSGIHNLAQRLGVTAVVTTPSVALSLADCGAIPSVKKLILIGEHASPPLRQRIQSAFDAATLGLFASTEAILGYEDPESPGIFRWNPEKLYLEVLHEDGTIGDQGTGELLVTKRYGKTMQVIRYRLGDRAEILSGHNGLPGFRFLGRLGHAFTLASGVKVSRAQVESFLDSLVLPLSRVSFDVHHGADGRDNLNILLQTPGPKTRIDVQEVQRRFETCNFEIEDVVNCGYLKTNVRVESGVLSVKRWVSFNEGPWVL